MNETRIDLPNSDFTFRERQEWPFVVTLGLGADGSIGVYNDEYTRTYVDRDALLERVKAIKSNAVVTVGLYSVGIVSAYLNEVIKLLEAK